MIIADGHHAKGRSGSVGEMQTMCCARIGVAWEKMCID